MRTAGSGDRQAPPAVARGVDSSPGGGKGCPAADGAGRSSCAQWGGPGVPVQQPPDHGLPRRVNSPILGHEGLLWLQEATWRLALHVQGQQRATQVRLGPGHRGVSSAGGATRLPLSSGPSPRPLPPAPGLTPPSSEGSRVGGAAGPPVCLWVPDVEEPRSFLSKHPWASRFGVTLTRAAHGSMGMAGPELRAALGPLGGDEPRPEGPEARLGGRSSGARLGVWGRTRVAQRGGGLTWRRRGPLRAAAVCRAPGWARVEGWGLWRVLRGHGCPPEPGPCPWLVLQSHRVRDSCLGELTCDAGGPFLKWGGRCGWACHTIIPVGDTKTLRR